MIEQVIVFYIGLSFGSFGNNIISHFSNNVRFDLFRSSCLCGKKELKFYELIPLVSFLFLKGKCSQCENNISKRYFLVELISGILALTYFAKYDFSIELGIYYFSSLIMLLIAFIDFSNFIIPNSLLVGLLFFSIINIFTIESLIITNIILAIVLILILLSINFFYSKHKKIDAIGYGDIKYIGVLTLLFSFPISLIALWFSALLAIPGFYIIKKLFNNYKNEHKIPFGLFLSMGYLITNLLDNWLIRIFNNFIKSY